MRRALALALIALLLLPVLASARTEQFQSVERERTGGHAILIEQYTATWCEVCATIDPWIGDFVSDHSGRVERIALHPDDHDPFGTPLTTARISELSPDENLGLPTFWFDGQGQVTGAVTYNRLAGAVMSAELDRDAWQEMRLEWNTHSTGDVIRVDAGPWTENASITLHLKQQRSMDSEIASNGIDEHEDVLTGQIRINASAFEYVGDAGYEVTWEALDREESETGYVVHGTDKIWGVVAVLTVDGEIRSVVGLQYEDGADPVDFLSLGAILFLFSALVLSTVILRRGSSD
jgi:hypothetical protein